MLDGYIMGYTFDTATILVRYGTLQVTGKIHLDTWGKWVAIPRGWAVEDPSKSHRVKHRPGGSPLRDAGGAECLSIAAPTRAWSRFVKPILVERAGPGAEE